MIEKRPSRWIRAAACAVLAATLLSSTGCGFFCLRNSQCDTGAGECCRRFRCTDICVLERVRVADQADEAAGKQAFDITDLLMYLFPPLK
jgi:hypothetical protein